MSQQLHVIDQARRLYADGLGVSEIAPKVGKSPRTVRLWAQQHGWKKHSSPEARLEAQIAALTDKKHKTDKDWRDLDRYARNLAQLRKGDEKRQERVKQERKSADEKQGDSWAYRYQRRFLEDQSILRIVKKGRQLGFSFIAAWEAYQDAKRRGRDKTFASASFRQTGLINEYIKKFARNRDNVKLKGREVIHLPNGANLHFVATNVATAQGMTGDLYFDEYAWVRNAKAFYENAGAIATRKDYRITIISTTSVHSHHYEELWKNGGPQWSRHLVTIIDAIEQGNTDIDLNKILSMFSMQAIRRLYMCETLDDEGAVFTFDALMACVYDDDEGDGIFAANSADVIWGGFDISRERDDSSAILVARGQNIGKPVFTWRKRLVMNRVPFHTQEQRLVALIDEWHPEEFTIDATTIGEHMAENIQAVLPSAQAVKFSPRVKAMLVLNMLEIVHQRRLRIPRDDRLIQSFLAIKRKSLETDVGFEANRGEAIGHADDFWALALACYPAWGGQDRNVIII